MDTTLFTKVKIHHIITLIERDDGNKTYKTLETEAGLPRVLGSYDLLRIVRT